jgi:hypothetical protein
MFLHGKNKDLTQDFKVRMKDRYTCVLMSSTNDKPKIFISLKRANKSQNWNTDGLCGLVVRLPGWRPRGPGLDYRRYQIFWVAVGLEWGPLSPCEDKLGATWKKSSGSGLENRLTTVRDPTRWPRDIPLSAKVGTGGRSVGIVRLRTKGHVVCLFLFVVIRSIGERSRHFMQHLCRVSAAVIVQWIVAWKSVHTKLHIHAHVRNRTFFIEILGNSELYYN